MSAHKQKMDRVQLTCKHSAHSYNLREGEKLQSTANVQLQPCFPNWFSRHRCQFYHNPCSLNTSILISLTTCVGDLFVFKKCATAQKLSTANWETVNSWNTSAKSSDCLSWWKTPFFFFFNLSVVHSSLWLKEQSMMLPPLLFLWSHFEQEVKAQRAPGFLQQ